MAEIKVVKTPFEGEVPEEIASKLVGLTFETTPPEKILCGLIDQLPRDQRCHPNIPPERSIYVSKSELIKKLNIAQLVYVKDWLLQNLDPDHDWLLVFDANDCEIIN